MNIAEETTETIKSALRGFGVRKGAVNHVSFVRRDSFSVDVYVKGKWFGLWDFSKRTFVE